MIKQTRWHDQNHCTNQQSTLKKTSRKKKENSWENQQKWNKNKKKNHKQLMNWEYINNWKTNILKNNYQKKKLCFHCKKKRYQIKKCRNLQHEKSTETWTWVTTAKELCEKKWYQNMKY